MSDWPSYVEACKNCTGEPSRYAHGSGEYCNRCYRLRKHIKDVQGWDRNRRETLKRIPKHGMYDPAVGYRDSTALINDDDTDEQFEICRKKNIRQLRERLALLHHREAIRRREVSVTGGDLEDKFRELLHLIRRKVSYPNYGTYLSTQFDEQRRRVIYALLEEIIEQAPWQGVRGVW
jgi:hypothetical protein